MEKSNKIFRIKLKKEKAIILLVAGKEKEIFWKQDELTNNLRLVAFTGETYIEKRE